MNAERDHSATRPRVTVGVVVAWAGFAFGSLASIGANILAEQIRPAGAPATWTPSALAEAGAAVWPVALLLSVEILSRISWPDSLRWKLARYGGVGAVALGSAFISYSHITDVLASPMWNYNAVGAHVGPLVIDGLMTVSGFALLAHAQRIQRVGDAPHVADTADPAPVAAATATASAVSAEPVGAARGDAPSPRVVPATKSPVREVVNIGTAADRRSRMLAYLDEHTGATGAELDRVFGTSNYGRSVRRAWEKQRRSTAQASGE